jgi:pyrroloquinoline-quinone synthase
MSHDDHGASAAATRHPHAVSDNAPPNGPPGALPEQALEDSIHRLGEEYYHDKHPFHLRMYGGKLSRAEIQGWVASRYYYQTRIPIKDSLIMAKPDSGPVRQEWIHRVMDHDGDRDRRGGLELWLDLAEAVGLDRDETQLFQLLSPQAKAAVDSYVSFIAEHPLFDCIAASLTELFATGLHQSRLDVWPKHYPWIDPKGYRYFSSRVALAPADAQWSLAYVRRHAVTADLQRRVREALLHKLGLLWDLATAIQERFTPAAADWKPRLAAKAKLRWDEIDKSHMLLLPEKGMKLNASAGNILQRCDGTRTQREVVAAMREAFPEGHPVEINISTMIFIDRMLGKGILE